MAAVSILPSSFETTQRLFQTTKHFLNEPNRNFLDLLTKVGAVVVAILATLPLILFDLTILAGKKIAQIFYPPIVSRAGKEPTDDTIRKINETPQIYIYSYGIGAPSQQIFKSALRDAFSYLNREAKNLYRDLIQNDGESDLPHLEENTPEIFQWCASVYLAYLLRLAYIQKDYYNEGDVQAIRDLQKEYRLLSPSERAAVLLTIYNHPTSEWKLTEKALKMVRTIQKMALELTQNQNYLRNTYHPVALEINQIFY